MKTDRKVKILTDYTLGEKKAAEREVTARAAKSAVPDATVKYYHARMKATKMMIFEMAIELFAQKTYDSVSLMDIASEAGIRYTNLFIHFASKQDILNTIYDFCDYYFVADRPTPEALETSLRNGGLKDIVSAAYHDFKARYQETINNCTKIVLQRAFIDKRATAIFRTILKDSGDEYVEYAFRHAILLGRVSPFDMRAFGSFFAMKRRYYYLCWLSQCEPAQDGALWETMFEMNQRVAAMLTDQSDENQALA